MLVLTRRVNEEIIIGGNIRIKVLDAQHHRVRLGVAAPSTLRVDRQEVADRRTALDNHNEEAFAVTATAPNMPR